MHSGIREHLIYIEYKMKHLKQYNSAGVPPRAPSPDERDWDLGDLIQENVSAQTVKFIPIHESVLVTTRYLKRNKLNLN